MDRGRVAWSTVDRRWYGPKAPKHGGALTGVWPPATPEHGSSPVGAQQREGNTGLGQRCGDRATAGKRQQRESSATAALGLWKMGRVRWGRCGDLRGRGGLFVRSGEGALRRGTQ
jgi:hypothetical protein